MVESDVVYMVFMTIFVNGFGSLILMAIPFIIVAASVFISLTLYVALKPLCNKWYQWIKKGLESDSENAYMYERYDIADDNAQENFIIEKTDDTVKDD